MFQQAVEIEPTITDRDTAAVSNAMDAESKAIFRSKSVVVCNEEPEETASYVTQSDQGQPDPLHRELTLGMDSWTTASSSAAFLLDDPFEDFQIDVPSADDGDDLPAAEVLFSLQEPSDGERS